VLLPERRRYALNIGRPPDHDLRTIMSAILYVDRKRDGVFAQLTGVLRRLLRQTEGERVGPSAAGSTRRA
jgi:hypothetical protein